jgi:hypothetical protein
MPMEEEPPCYLNPKLITFLWPSKVDTSKRILTQNSDIFTRLQACRMLYLQ